MAKKIVIDPGHGGNDPGSSGSGLLEKNINLDIALHLGRILSAYGKVKLTRESDTFISLNDRAALANTFGADLFVSIHVNAGGGTGFESFIYSYAKAETDAIREIIHKEVAAFYTGMGFPDRGMKRANFAVLRETLMPALLLENLFIDTAADTEKLKDPEFRQKVSEVVAQGIIKAMGLEKPRQNPIIGPAKATSNQVKRALSAQNPQADLSVVDYYYLYSEKFGIASDLAVCQAIKETGWFKFTGLVKAWQNNFSGIGATGDAATGTESLNGADSRVVSYQAGVHGAVFKAKEWGVKAHFQHLFAYATTRELPDEILVDPRFVNVPRGIAPNYEDLNGRWAVPGTGYGESIVAIRDKIVTNYPEIGLPGDYETLKQENSILKADNTRLLSENASLNQATVNCRQKMLLCRRKLQKQKKF